MTVVDIHPLREDLLQRLTRVRGMICV